MNRALGAILRTPLQFITARISPCQWPTIRINIYESNGTGRDPPDANPVYHRSDYSLPVAHDNGINDGLNSHYYGFSNSAFECSETSPESDITGESWWVSDLNKPELAIRDEPLVDFKPEAWELSE